MGEVCSAAARKATEYIKDNKTSLNFCSSEYEELERERIEETYKILIIPDDTLNYYLQSLDREGIKNEFRRLAMLIHPDKNNHPSSKVAFQKLYHHV